MDIEIKKKEDLYIVEKSILNNIIKEDIEIMEEYKINEMEISIITCNNRKETQEEMIKERKTNSIIKKKNENMNLINIIREKWNKRWMYIKNIDNSNLDNVMKNIQ
jgi:F0F1-type ATP synthase epsilon subunit